MPTQQNVVWQRFLCSQRKLDSLIQACILKLVCFSLQVLKHKAEEKRERRYSIKRTSKFKSNLASLSSSENHVLSLGSLSLGEFLNVDRRTLSTGRQRPRKMTCGFYSETYCQLQWKPWQGAKESEQAPLPGGSAPASLSGPIMQTDQLTLSKWCGLKNCLLLNTNLFFWILS